MAYNINRFETIYGFSFLDEIHNFFPELLYDEGIFPHTMLRWMRHRVSGLFPNVYVRQQNMYNIYNADPRMRSYLQWLNEPVLTNAPPARPPIAPVDISGAPAPVRRNTRAAPPPPLRVESILPNAATQSSAIFTHLLWELRDPAAWEIDQVMNDVSVAPSAGQINSASVLRNSDGISSDINCSICQEHESESSIWRVLNCGHMYHKNCIDVWLQSHVQCPICRVDVRTLAGIQNST